MAHRIVHFADLHLDTAFTSAGMTASVASRRREELRGALIRILDRAAALGADAITIGGDLYEQDRCNLDTGNFLRSAFERLAPVRVLISPGNHDPWVPHSLYRQISWPSNVFVFSGATPQPYRLGDLTVWGAAHTSPSCRENLVAATKVPTEGTHILLLHASDVSSVPKGKSVCCPLTVADIKRAGFVLALLGHYHGASFAPADSPTICYPGSPEPLGFDEEGSHYMVIVDVTDQGVRSSKEQINQTTYIKLDVDVSGADTRQSIKDAVVAEGATRNLYKAFVRVRLTGMLHPQVDLDLEAMLADLSECFAFVDLRDDTRPAYDLDTLKSDLTAKGAFVRKMLLLIEKASPSERRRAEEALNLGLQALDAGQVRPR